MLVCCINFVSYIFLKVLFLFELHFSRFRFCSYLPFSLSSTSDLVGTYLLTLSLHSKVPSELVHEKSFLTFVEKVLAFQVKLQLGFFFLVFFLPGQFCDLAEVAIIHIMMMI